ncbi:hypothetical protein [Kitasatospora viridis]|uniref:hypothetical protein n=1 Tax=Kitasatospora viridis TaxID=281105 RepID=UPI001FECD5AD|nr:hypothetical protein [Kitasatospora viridis]
MDTTGYTMAMVGHCPFLEPSIRRGLTGWTVYEIAPGAHRDAVEAELFHAAVRGAEWIRPQLAHSQGALVCENIVITGSVPDADHRELMTWPHWALKHLYGPVGVMFGKFTQGAGERDKFGRSIPPPPFSFLPVRAAVRHSDPRFLRDTPDLAHALAVADDDGRDVFEHIPCEWKAVRAWAGSLPVPPKR